MKVGREAMVGVYAAVKHFLDGGAEAIPHVHVKLSPSRFRSTRDQIREQLLAEEPRILVRPAGPNGIRVNAATLSEGQEQVVSRRLKEVLLGAVRRSRAIRQGLADFPVVSERIDDSS